MFWEEPEISEIRSIEISTTCRGYGPAPEIGDELMQLIKIFASGRVRFTRTFYGKKDEIYNCSISKESAFKIIDAVLKSTRGSVPHGCDMLTWTVTIDPGITFDRPCAGCIDDTDVKFGRYNLSGYIRRNLVKGRKDFNGKPLTFDPYDCYLFDGHRT